MLDFSPFQNFCSVHNNNLLEALKLSYYNLIIYFVVIKQINLKAHCVRNLILSDDL